ncbi:MAG: TIM barrel protein [Clostridia bacterium]|nr:TIM barrel protein [Clostridia bacterium]
MIKIGPAGNSKGFYESGRKHTYQEGEYLSQLGLNAFEYSFGRGVHLTDETAQKIREQMEKYGVEISVHAPYYTNFANPDDEMIEKSIGYILQSVDAVKRLGGRRVVFHPASQGKLDRETALELSHKNLKKLADALDDAFGETDYIVCPETMGKNKQIGTVEEVVEFCKIHPKFYPCFDFGHINSYTHGGIKSEEDYRKIIDYAIAHLGEEKVKNMHIHFSKIMYGASGEIKHLTLEDEIYGPNYEPLAKIIDEYGLTPYIICESRDIMAEDAVIMKNFHKNG